MGKFWCPVEYNRRIRQWWCKSLILGGRVQGQSCLQSSRIGCTARETLSRKKKYETLRKKNKWEIYSNVDIEQNNPK